MIIQKEKFSNKQIPRPGYYIDIVKETDFYKKSLPYPEFKQFSLVIMNFFLNLKQMNFLDQQLIIKKIYIIIVHLIPVK